MTSGVYKITNFDLIVYSETVQAADVQGKILDNNDDQVDGFQDNVYQTV